MNINTKRIFSKSCIAASAAALCLMATACGDDSSSSPKNDPIIENPDVPGDSTVIPGGDTPADSTIIPDDPSTPTDSTVVPGEGDETDPGELPAEGPITLPEGKGLLVDDFEDGDLQSNSGGYWFAYDDTENGASSSITFPINDADENVAARVNNGSNYALKVNYTLDKGGYEYNPYVGWGVNISEDDSNDRFGGITYWYKGGAHTVRIETSDVTNYDVHFAKVKASRVWTQAVIRFKDLVQNGWDGEVPFDPKHMNAISFQAQGSTKVYSDSLFIDNLYLQDTSEVAPDVKDMTINDPLIPEDLSEGQDITINTELQAKAMKYLDKGINFTNWLENADGKFKKFVYDETDVKTVADAGFKSLRLPIDLDLYATNRNDFIKGTAKELEFDDETLFTVLDSFVNWTAKYNMSFVIDYHEYDNSYNRESANDPNYVKMMAETWKHVAAHYADNSREDLFFELLNEPDMTDGKVTQAQWTVASTAIIEAIRSVDTKHTLLFGDAQWYSMSLLAKRTPFEDKNIVYVIHTYEPFAFTHQGGSWTDYATIKNLPFPYDPAKWSEYSADFGVTKTTLKYVKDNIKNYYKTANKNYIKNSVWNAKQWAITNQVPIIINEYGALGQKSDMESNLNYLRTMREISEELQIPMTHWGYDQGFGVFENGVLKDGVSEAMGLGK